MVCGVVGAISGEKEVQRGRGVEEGQKKFADLYLCAFREIRSGSRTILAYARAARRSSLLASSVLLATTGGFLDGFTYVGHGHVFANAMTGNVVLLGINCIFGSWQTGFRHLPPILAFLVGTSAARFLTLSFCQLAAFVSRPSRFSSSRSRASSCSRSCRQRRAIFGSRLRSRSSHRCRWRRFVTSTDAATIRPSPPATCARSAKARSTGSSRDAPRPPRAFAAICVAFLVGASSGGLATTHLGNHALWITVALLIVVAFRVRSGGSIKPDT